VHPSAIGNVTVSVAPFSVSDDSGNLYTGGVGMRGAGEDSADLHVVEFLGGECSVELACSLDLATYEHELALKRVDEEARLATDRDRSLEETRARAARELEEYMEHMRQEGEKARLDLTTKAEKERLDQQLAADKERAAAEAAAAVERLAAELAAQAEADAERHTREVAAELQKQEQLRATQAAQAALEAGNQEKAAELERESDVKRADLQRETDRLQAEAEAEQRIREARATQDLKVEQAEKAAAVEGAEKRKAIIDATLAVLSFLGDGAREVAASPRLQARGVAIAGALFLLYFFARESMRVLAKLFARWAGTPSLVRETSKTLLPRWRPRAMAPQAALKDVILEEGLHTRIERVATATALARERGAPFRHLLFYGSPGTGKTMAAERLARSSGLDYAIMSGGDVVPLGKQAVSELHALFDWAVASPRGLLLFIDEADAFLQRRHGLHDVGEQMRAAINALLARTGTQQGDFLLVLASNRPEDLDAAVLDRIDEVVHFPLPERQQRESILRLYFEKYVGTIREKPGSDGKAGSGAWEGATPVHRSRSWSGLTGGVQDIELQGFSAGALQKAAERTHGFSGRELAKLMAAVQAHVYASGGGGRGMHMTIEEFMEIVGKKKEEHDVKTRFNEAADGPLSPTGLRSPIRATSAASRG